MNKTLTTERCQAAYDEAKRELEVRERCYARWVKDGKISRTDANTRFQAQQDIVTILADHPAVEVAHVNPTENAEWKPPVTDTNTLPLPTAEQQRQAA